MNEMRLPGLGLLNNDTASTQGGSDANRDPAQAFDAVMSRLSNEKPAQPAPTTPATARKNEDRANAKTAVTAGGPNAQPNARPVARTKPKDTDATTSEAGCEPVADDASSDPTALMLSVVESAQLVAQNPLAAAAAAAAAGVPADEKKTDAASTDLALDILASQAKGFNGRPGEKTSAEPRSPVTTDEGVPAASTGTNRRTTAAAKDTLRIDAPLMRNFDAARADVAERLAAVASNVMQAGRNQAAAVPSGENAAQAIAAAVAAGNNNTSTYSIAHAAVATPVTQSGFANELAQRVVVFAGQKVQRAEISVTPADLGPIAISIEVRGQEATLAFAASSHTTRAAIEDALPKLREMLSGQGLQLAGAHVGSEPRRDPYRPARHEKSAPTIEGAGGVSAASAAPTAATVRRTINLIDIEV